MHVRIDCVCVCVWVCVCVCVLNDLLEDPLIELGCETQ